MIGFLDTFTLARTKLRAKRILLAVTIIISGLLFGVLTGAIIITTGAKQSISQFFETSQKGHYLVMAAPNIPPDVGQLPSPIEPLSKEQIAEFTALQKEYEAKQKAIYTAQKLPFDPTKIEPVLEANPMGARDKNGIIYQSVNYKSPVSQEYIKRQVQRYVATADTTVEKLTKQAERYGSTAIYQFRNTVADPTSLNYLSDGTEHIEKFGQLDFSGGNGDWRSMSVKNASYVVVDNPVVERLIFSVNQARADNPNAVPVILNTAEIVSLFGKQLGIPEKPNNPIEQTAWYKNLYQKANGLTYNYCYRSPGEIALIQKTKQTNTELVDKKDDPNYQPPALQYNLPTETCGPLTVKKDTRSALEKTTDAKQETVEKELGTYQPLEHRLITFQIVGAFTLASQESTKDPASFMGLFFGPNYQFGAFIPQQMYNKLPPDTLRDSVLMNSTHPDDSMTAALEAAHIKSAILTFPTIKAARSFIDHEGCAATANPADCKKPFLLSSYGTNYLAVNDFGNTVQRYLPYAFLGVMVIASIIILVTMARVIIDSRRETAVFRALGAKRRDIASVYLTYSLLVALSVVLFAFVLGVILALLAQHFVSASATSLAQVAYGVFDTSAPSFQLVRFDLPLLGLVAAAVIVISLIAVTPPLIRNVRRSPIRDMRDE